jgi:hypothetical protein
MQTFTLKHKTQIEYSDLPIADVLNVASNMPCYLNQYLIVNKRKQYLPLTLFLKLPVLCFTMQNFLKEGEND